MEYQYCALPRKGHIRLLTSLERVDDKLFCTLQSYPLDEAPAYSAVSYAWGCPLRALRDEPEPVWKDEGYSMIVRSSGGDATIMIGRNLFDFMWELCSTGFCSEDGKPVQSPYIWADAMCINQKDNEERSSQVAQMGAIYSTATEVIAWLGSDTRDLKEFLWFHEGVKAFEGDTNMRMALMKKQETYMAWLRMQSSAGPPTSVSSNRGVGSSERGYFKK